MLHKKYLCLDAWRPIHCYDYQIQEDEVSGYVAHTKFLSEYLSVGRIRQIWEDNIKMLIKKWGGDCSLNSFGPR
jgi:hypothetical protein